MPSFNEAPPLSLYVHLPWCIRKCPYCDFNSHALRGELAESQYVSALLNELDEHLQYLHQQNNNNERELISIFFGGGTPSLFSAAAIEAILSGIRARMPLSPCIEITLEANPGTVEIDRFKGYRHAGVNRLSLGIQSLQNKQLMQLGRIHDKSQAEKAILAAHEAQFTEINADIMYGLPKQTLDEAMADLRAILAYPLNHFSWYQLTLEPNTLFFHQPPPLPNDEVVWDMQQTGLQILIEKGWQQYEVSAFAKEKKYCLHNLNYWQYGDYLGIGAGAHSKITDYQGGKIVRFSSVKHPKEYMNGEKRKTTQKNILEDTEIAFEFMLNGLRLQEGISHQLFKARTGLTIEEVEKPLIQAKQQGLIDDDPHHFRPTAKGRQYLNNLIALFLP